MRYSDSFIKMLNVELVKIFRRMQQLIQIQYRKNIVHRIDCMRGSFAEFWQFSFPTDSDNPPETWTHILTQPRQNGISICMAKNPFRII